MLISNPRVLGQLWNILKHLRDSPAGLSWRCVRQLESEVSMRECKQSDSDWLVIYCRLVGWKFRAIQRGQETPSSPVILFISVAYVKALHGFHAFISVMYYSYLSWLSSPFYPCCIIWTWFVPLFSHVFASFLSLFLSSYHAQCSMLSQSRAAQPQMKKQQVRLPLCQSPASSSWFENGRKVTTVCQVRHIHSFLKLSGQSCKTVI